MSETAVLLPLPPAQPSVAAESVAVSVPDATAPPLPPSAASSSSSSPSSVSSKMDPVPEDLANLIASSLLQKFQQDSKDIETECPGKTDFPYATHPTRGDGVGTWLAKKRSSSLATLASSLARLYEEEEKLTFSNTRLAMKILFEGVVKASKACTRALKAENLLIADPLYTREYEYPESLRKPLLPLYFWLQVFLGFVFGVFSSPNFALVDNSSTRMALLIFGALNVLWSFVFSCASERDRMGGTNTVVFIMSAFFIMGAWLKGEPGLVVNLSMMFMAAVPVVGLFASEMYDRWAISRFVD